MNDNFYKNLQGFHQFAELTNSDYYTDVPADWYVVATDIKNSTQAIAEGKYKEVNLIGAATIIAILNIASDILIPYVFGGDGASLLIPPGLLQKTQEALAAVRLKALIRFGMELRGGCIPLKTLYHHGATLQVAKLHLSATMSQAMFQGTALALADTWLKKGNVSVLRCERMSNAEPNLNGLQCRWQPIENRNGKMINLMVRVTPEFSGQALPIYAEILREIGMIYPDYTQSCPAYISGMKLILSPAKLDREVQLHARMNSISRLLYSLNIMILNAIGAFCIKSGYRIGGFNGKKFLSELVVNNDARKFDEMLRMVLDSNQEQHDALEHMLTRRKQKGEITYGIHLSSQALMTCLVFNLNGNHMHFIDGIDGGYALAAQNMKQQNNK